MLGRLDACNTSRNNGRYIAFFVGDIVITDAISEEQVDTFEKIYSKSIMISICKMHDANLTTDENDFRCKKP